MWILSLLSALALAQTPVPEGYRIDARDKLDISVYGEPGLSVQGVEVAEGGLIDLNLIGRTDVDGLTALEVARQLEALYESGYLVNPQITVRVASYGSKEVSVQGAVKNDGIYYLTRPMTVTDVLALAGGATNDDIKEVHIRRGEADTIVVNLAEAIATGSGNIYLQKGDVVYVPEGLAVYIGGEVARPGEVAFTEGMTLTQAITLAGSWKTTALKTTVYILRDGQRMKVNVRRILKAKDADILLQAGDQVEVPESVI